MEGVFFVTIVGKLPYLDILQFVSRLVPDSQEQMQVDAAIACVGGAALHLLVCLSVRILASMYEGVEVQQKWCTGELRQRQYPSF